MVPASTLPSEPCCRSVRVMTAISSSGLPPGLTSTSGTRHAPPAPSGCVAGAGGGGQPGGHPEEEIAVITLTDLQQGSDGKVLAGPITCNLTSGGITVNTQHMGGMELERQEEGTVSHKAEGSVEFTYPVLLDPAKTAGDL
ncbi:hypothetical protein ACOMHN_051045 [Nucella lapillus]